LDKVLSIKNTIIENTFIAVNDNLNILKEKVLKKEENKNLLNSLGGVQLTLENILDLEKKLLSSIEMILEFLEKEIKQSNKNSLVYTALYERYELFIKVKTMLISNKLLQEIIRKRVIEYSSFLVNLRYILTPMVETISINKKKLTIFDIIKIKKGRKK